MNIITLYESAYKDGYTSFGDGDFYLDEAVADQAARNRHDAYAVCAIHHPAIEVEDGRYLLLKPPVIPVSVVGTVQAQEDIRKIALAKLTPQERTILGFADKEAE